MECFCCVLTFMLAFSAISALFSMLCVSVHMVNAPVGILKPSATWAPAGEFHGSTSKQGVLTCFLSYLQAFQPHSLQGCTTAIFLYNTPPLKQDRVKCRNP